MRVLDQSDGTVHPGGPERESTAWGILVLDGYELQNVEKIGLCDFQR